VRCIAQIDKMLANTGRNAGWQVGDVGPPLVLIPQFSPVAADAGVVLWLAAVYQL
jgi:hypothetical protein